MFGISDHIGITCAICNKQIPSETAKFVWINDFGKYNNWPSKQWVCSEECATFLIFQIME